DAVQKGAGQLHHAHLPAPQQAQQLGGRQQRQRGARHRGTGAATPTGSSSPKSVDSSLSKLRSSQCSRAGGTRSPERAKIAVMRAASSVLIVPALFQVRCRRSTATPQERASE